MGTDIHLAVEVRENGQWRNATPFRDEDGYLSNYPNGYYESRNYNLFAILGNVRNGRGFAGVSTGDGFNPLTDGRGIPEDAAEDVRRWAENGDHSHSFCTLAELLAYDWTQTTKLRGWVNVHGWTEFACNGSPRSWSGGVGGGLVTHHAVAEFDAAWAEFKKRHDRPESHKPWHLKDEQIAEIAHIISPGSQPHTCVEWEIPYYQAGRELLSETMPKLWRLGAPDDVRLVFWFDS